MTGSLAISIARLHRSGSAFIVNKLADLGIGAGQHPFLLALAEKKKLNQEELSRLLSVDKATTARAVQRLEAANFVNRTIDPHDARAYSISLSPQGEKAIPRIQEALASWEQHLLDIIDMEAREDFKRILENLAMNS